MALEEHKPFPVQHLAAAKTYLANKRGHEEGDKQLHKNVDELDVQRLHASRAAPQQRFQHSGTRKTPSTLVQTVRMIASATLPCSIADRQTFIALRNTSHE